MAPLIPPETFTLAVIDSMYMILILRSRSSSLQTLHAKSHSTATLKYYLRLHILDSLEMADNV